MATNAHDKPKKTTVVAKSSRATSVSVKKDSPRTFRSIVTNFYKDVSPQALLAEMGGTFVLVSAVLFTSGDAFFTGVTLVVLALSVFALSGANLNPAVSFGLWTARKISATRMLAYWVAQFIGAIAAIVLVHLFSGLVYNFSLASFGSFEPKIFFAELLGTAVFLFGFMAAINRNKSDTGKAVGIGLSLFVGLVMATGLLSEAVTGYSKVSSTTSSTSRLQKVNNVTLNPAVALALTERDPNASQTSTAETTTPVLPSRLTVETILGTLFGAAIGANLFVLLAGRKSEV